MNLDFSVEDERFREEARDWLNDNVPRERRPQHIWLQEMQGRMSSGRPSRALFAICGSAIWPRTMLTMSAWPEPITESAFSGVRMWLSAWTRTCFTARLIASACGGPIFSS